MKTASNRFVQECCKLIAVLAVSQIGAETNAPGQPVRELKIKAAYIYNTSNFVVWPDPDSPKEHSSTVFGVYGDTAFAQVLRQTLKEKSTPGRPLEVRELSSVEQATECQVLFIGAVGRKTQARLLKAVEKLPILTFAEQSGFAKAGGIINFFREKNNLRFEVNVTQAASAKLEIHPRLLGLARVIKTPPKR